MTDRSRAKSFSKTAGASAAPPTRIQLVDTFRHFDINGDNVLDAGDIAGVMAAANYSVESECANF